MVGYSPDFEEANASAPNSASSSPRDENDIFAVAVAAAKEKRNSGPSQTSTELDAQLEFYFIRFSSKNAPTDSDERLFWDGTADFPLLKEIAISVLSIPATSAPVERIFSIAGNILAEERLRLSDSNLENQIMIRVNKNLMKSVFFD